MKLIFTLFLVVFISFSLNPQSFRTEIIDGSNSFSSANERFETTNGTSLYGFVTWDKDYLYAAYSGNSTAGPVTDDNRVFHFYIDTDPQVTPTSGTGSIHSDAWRWNPTLPFTANFHYAFKTVDNSEYRKYFNGSTWVDSIFTTQNYKGASYWEIKIKLRDLGSPKQIYFVSYVEEDWSGGYINGGLPSNLFTNTTTSGSVAFNANYLSLYLNDEVNPNASFNLNNYQWQIQLNASGGTLSDTSVISGMAVNATDNYDSGIDLPKPPATPSSYLSIYFPHTDWTSALGPKYKRDFRSYKSLDSTTVSWDVSVATDLVNQTITLSASSYDFVPSNYHIYLYDIANDVTHDLRSSNYQFTSGAMAATYYFRLIVGNTFSSPNISADVTSLNFGSMKTNKDSTKNLVITNIGDSALVISNVLSTNSFYTFTGGTTYTIAKNNSITIPVTFSPKASGLIEAKLLILSNDPDTDTLTVSLSGTGVALQPHISISTNSLDFGSVKMAYDSTLIFKIYNSGDTTLAVTSLTSSSTNFTVNTSVPLTVGVNDSVTVSVTFSPDAVKSYSDSLLVVSSDASTGQLKIALLGTGMSSTLSKTFTAGWNLISLPLHPLNQSVSAVIGDDITSYFLYNYSNSAGYQSPLTVDRNIGYWLGIETGAMVDVSGEPKVTDDSAVVLGGWNLLGSPFLKKYPTTGITYERNGIKVSADSAVSLGWIQNGYFKYNTTAQAYENADTLVNWEGYWFASLMDSVKIHYPKTNQVGSLPKKATQELINPNEWFVNITASMNASKDNLLYFGESDAATDGFDSKYDAVKPPISPNGILETYFLHADWNKYFSKYAYDVKQSTTSKNVSWQFVVTAKQSANVTLDWKNILTEIPSEVQQKLVTLKLTTPDIAAFGSIDMLKQFSVIIPIQKDGGYTFVINASVTDVNGNNPEIPATYALLQNFPNPFNPATSIRFDLPKSSFITIKVYDVLGNEVATILNETKNAGSYTIPFSAINLASGTYFYRIQAGEFVKTKKMIILK